jgi:hypothetical protein
MSVQCTDHAHTCIYKLKRRFHALFEFASMIVYILVQTLFKQCTCRVKTLNAQVQVFMYIEYKSKKLPKSGDLVQTA